MYCGCNPAEKVSITMNSALNVDGEQIDSPLCVTEQTTGQ